MANIVLGICGGFHTPQDTDGMLRLWNQTPEHRAIPALVLGAEGGGTVLSAYALRHSLESSPVLDQPLSQPSHPCAHPKGHSDLILWAFSAGCVGAVALAYHWQRYRGTVRAIFLVDGWGVPWAGTAPLHRLSHDAFTHHSSRRLGAGQSDFWAHPAVPHLQLWRSPQTVMGCGELPPTAIPGEFSPPRSAADFLLQWTRFYGLPSSCPRGLPTFS